MKHELLQEEKKRLIVILLITFIGFVGASIAYPILPPLFLETHHHTIISPEWSMGTKRFLLGLTLALFHWVNLLAPLFLEEMLTYMVERKSSSQV